MVTTVVRCVASMEMSAGCALYSAAMWSSPWTPASPRLSNTALPDALCLRDWANFSVSRPSPRLKKSFVSHPARWNRPSKLQRARPQSVTAHHKVLTHIWRCDVSKCVARWGLDQWKLHKNNRWQYDWAGPIWRYLLLCPTSSTWRQGPLIDKGLNWCCVIFFLAPGVLMEWLAVTLVYANSSFAIRAKWFPLYNWSPFQRLSEKCPSSKLCFVETI